MSSLRAKKVSDQIKREIASLIIEGKIKDPRLGFVTITDVETSRDLKYSKIYYTVYDNENNSLEITGEILNGAKKFFRMQIGKNLHLKFVPDLVFKPDTSFEYGQKIDTIIDEITTKKNENSVSGMSEFLLDNDDFLIISHMDPDGDTIGLKYILNSLNKISTLYCVSPIPETFDFLLKTDIKFHTEKNIKKHYDTIILIDLNQWKRCGRYIYEQNVTYNKIAIIDHHHTKSDVENSVNLIDSTCTSLIERGKLIKPS